MEASVKVKILGLVFFFARHKIETEPKRNYMADTEILFILNFNIMTTYCW
uniref:Uncharacterized protein n=1 Tax=Rhodnius prolixus TaxID=13249 RepID=T1HSZ5_RHOPR